MKLKIASRKSDLARIQAYTVGRSLQQQHPDLDIEYFFSTSLGDQNQDDPLWKMPEKGVFTSDLTEKLLEGHCDIVVHSWKDLPVEENLKTAVVATLPREDARDLLLIKKQVIQQKPENVKIYSSSPRREYHLIPFLKWALPWKCRSIEFLPVRGNIQTRISKMLAGEVAGLVVAKSALDRMLSESMPEFKETQRHLREGIENCQWMVVPLSQNPGAPAQGALAIEALRDRPEISELFEKIHCEKTFKNVISERSLFKKFGGGCHQKIGITQSSEFFGDILWASGQTPGGETFSFRKVLKLENSTTVVAREQMYPVQGVDEALFDRQKIPLGKLNWDHDIWIARFEAWSDSIQLHKNRIVWTSGVETWKKLAGQGVWISGTNDSMGEDFAMGLDHLLGRKPDFIKVTHEEACHLGSMPAVGTYRLVSKESSPDLTYKTHFYWMSFSAFLEAMKTNPQILDKNHACGPGNTYNQLSKFLGESRRISVFLSREDWLNHFSPGGTTDHSSKGIL